MRSSAGRAGAKRPQIFESIDSGAVAIMPTELDGIIADAANLLKGRLGHGNKLPLRAMALAHRAGAITAQIRLVIFANMAVIPGDAHHAARFQMIYFSWRSGHRL